MDDTSGGFETMLLGLSAAAQFGTVKSESGEPGNETQAPPPAAHAPAKVLKMTLSQEMQAAEVEALAAATIAQIETQLIESNTAFPRMKAPTTEWLYSGWTNEYSDGLGTEYPSEIGNASLLASVTPPETPDEIWTQDIAYIHINWSGANYGIKNVLAEFPDDSRKYDFQHIMMQAAQIWMESGIDVQIYLDGFAADDPGWSGNEADWGEVSSDEILVFATDSSGSAAIARTFSTERKAAIQFFDELVYEGENEDIIYHIVPDDDILYFGHIYLPAITSHEFGHVLGMADNYTSDDYAMNGSWTMGNANNYLRGPTKDEIEALWSVYGRDSLNLDTMFDTSGISWTHDDDLSGVATWQPVDIAVDEDDDRYQIAWFSETTNHMLHVAWYDGYSSTLSNHYYYSDARSFNGASLAHDGVDTSLVAFAGQWTGRHPRYAKITNDNSSATIGVVDDSVSVIGRPGIGRTSYLGNETWVYAAIVEHTSGLSWHDIGKILIWTSQDDGSTWSDPVQLSDTFHGLRGATVACTGDNQCRVATNRTGRPAYQYPCYLLSMRFHIATIAGNVEAVYDGVNTTSSYSAWGPAISVKDSATDNWMMVWLGLTGADIYHRTAIGTGAWGTRYQCSSDAEEGLGVVWNDDWETTWELLYPDRDY